MPAITVKRIIDFVFVAGYLGVPLKGFQIDRLNRAYKSIKLGGRSYWDYCCVNRLAHFINFTYRSVL